MKILLGIFVVALLCFGVAYAATAFVMLDINAYNWTVAARMSCVETAAFIYVPAATLTTVFLD